MSEELSTNVEDSDLKDLIDSSYPLLQKFREECPGTYKHSQAVSSYVEGVSISLGLDVTRMKVAALYHDIGKMFNPLCYSENQLDDENMHDNLHPKASYQLITQHVSNTALILMNDGNFPTDLIKIMCQHHGTSILRFFYDKHGGDDENYFRYKTESPTTVEAAILMLCDCIEARSRSEVISRGKDFNPKNIVEETLNSLMADNQLDDVVIRLGDLHKIKIALGKEIQGSYQKRVDYSTVSPQKDELIEEDIHE